MDPSVKEPTVTVGDITLSDISLTKMIVNTTVLVHNPNPFGGRISRVAFDVYHPADGPKYLGHGEKKDIDIKENGTTEVTIPVTVGTMDAATALSSLVRKGSITLDVNGSAFVDLKVMPYEKPFRQSRTYTTQDLESVLPAAVLSPGSFNVSEKLGQARDILAGLSG